MANEIETKVEPTKSAKSVKRVRFSDEIKRVDFHESDDSSSFSIENDNTNISITTIERPNDVINEDSIVNNPVIESNDSSITLGPDDNNNNELLDYPQNVTISFPASPKSNDTTENEYIDQSECNPTENTVKLETSHESPELMELINETKSMTISPTNIAKLIPDPSLIGKKFHPSSCRTNSEKSECPDSIHEIKQIPGISLSRKRSLEGVILEKQTSKLNSCLRKSNSECNSADKLKTAVFNAWNEVKNESPVQTSGNVSNMKKNNDASNQSTSHRAYEMWKKSKIKSRKTSLKISEPPSHKSKSIEDLEESKLAFKAWKKNKDEIIKHQIVEKYRKEAKDRSDSLINERTRKNEAESAFSAW